MSTPYSNQIKVEENFNSIFNNKGIVGSVAEKAMNNYQQKKQSRKDNSSNYQLHYFGIGHVFKNLETKEIFKYNFDGLPTQFITLYKDNFNFRTNPNLFFTNSDKKNDLENDFLFKLIDATRNVNGHFIHKFDVLQFKENDNPLRKSIIPFIKESFTLALVLAYQKKLSQKKDAYIPSIETLLQEVNSTILHFAKEVFYQSLYTKIKVSGKYIDRDLKENQLAIKDYIDNFNKLNDFVDLLLFNDVEEKIEWNLNPNEQDTHRILDIEKGRYLSFNGCLFLFSMFLYKNEANKLIPKISGFKKNGTAEDQAKINIFTIFSKKFSSQDILHEEQNLINFRDIIQYLNKYPVAWKSFLEFDENKEKITDKNLIERDYPFTMVNPLKEKIEIQEIQKYFPYVFSYYDLLIEKDPNKAVDYQNKKDAFLKYAINKLFRKNNPKQNILFDHFIEKNIDFQHIYFRVLLNQVEPSNKQFQINKDTFGGNTAKFKKQILNIITKDFIKTPVFDSWNYKNRPNNYFFKDFDVNLKTDKLKKRIEEKSVYTSNCRNQDRFLLFAIRYLAETNYFGENAKFKMNQFYDMLEQNSHINTLSKKEQDELKYDGGKIVCFRTYKKHLGFYPDWEMPFLVENNAVYIQIPTIERTICMQKNIIVYFLEDALNGNTNGVNLLNDFINFKFEKYNNFKEILAKEDSINDIQKEDFSKIFPKRLLHLFNPAKQNNLPKYSTFELILKRAEFMEARYEKLKNQAEENGTIDFFEKKNKGRQFKLQFIRKACNIMYFRDSYIETTKNNGHHKANNISKNEINDFSKWMFLFEGNDVYKQKLEQLFNSKNFFKNEKFKTLFDESQNLNDFYNKAKVLFKIYPFIQNKKLDDQKEVLKNYIENHLEKGNIYLNHALFKEYISPNETSIKVENDRIKYKYVGQNKRFLIDEFYYKSKIDSKEPKANRHLFAKLNANRLEDCLLFEIAFKYLNKENNQLKAKVNEVLVRDITFEVKKKNQTNHNSEKYKIIVPFSKVDRFFELNNTKGINEDHVVIKNIRPYLENVQKLIKDNYDQNKIYFDKEIIQVAQQFIKSRELILEDVNKVNNHIINISVRFTKCVMVLEEYFIWKHKIFINEENRIVLTEIKELYCDKNQPTGKYFNEDQTVSIENRNKALHYNLPPTDVNYYKALLIFEKNYIKEEITTKINKTLDEKGKLKEKVLENFMMSIHDKDTFEKQNFKNAKVARISELTEEHKNKFKYVEENWMKNKSVSEKEKDKKSQLEKFIVDKYWSKEESKVRKQKSIEEYIKIVNGLL
jgi:hypothetical protein